MNSNNINNNNGINNTATTTTTTTTTGNNNTTNPVKQFEDAFDACVGILANSNCQQSIEADELKLSVDQCVKKFIDNAKDLETFFIQRRFQIVNQRPEQLLTEDISDIKNEIARKEHLIERFNEKINHWQSILTDTPMASTQSNSMLIGQNNMINNLQQQMTVHPSMNIRHQQQRSPIQPIANNPSPMMQPQQQSPMHQPSNMRMMSPHPYQAQTYTPQIPNTQMMNMQSPHPNQQPITPQSLIPDSPMSSPMNHQINQMHPQTTYTPNPQQSQQSPLAFLEKTTKSIY